MSIEFNKVTWYSKFAAVIVFVVIWAIGFYLGTQYQATKIVPLPTGMISTSTPINNPPDNQPGQVIVSNGNEVTLRVGQTGDVRGLRITFNSLVQDSRCPIDVQCIQAGAVTANVTFVQGPHIERRNMPSDEVPLEFENHKISIVNVAPERRVGQEIAPGDYKLTFKIE